MLHEQYIDCLIKYIHNLLFFPSIQKPTQCSADLPCSDDKFCVPFMSKCSSVERTNCYIDDHCPNDETCDNFIGYCLKQPECLNTRPYSFCRKVWVLFA